jgi:hypothetical protein
MHGSKPLLAFHLIAASSIAAQGTAKTLPSEGPGPVAPAYRSDSLALRLEIPFGRLEVIAERNPSTPGIASGKYYVRLSGRRIAVADDPSLTLGAPDLAGYYPGEPTVVLLSTYTGGNGASAIPAYYIKIIAFSRDQRGATTSHVYSLGGHEDVGSDRFHIVSGPADGRFTLSSGEYTLTYIDGTLRLESGAAATAAPTPTPSPEEERAYVVAMRSDLRNLVTAEEAFFADSIKYTTNAGKGGLNFRFSPGNHLIKLTIAGDGWNALIGNTRTSTVCAIFIGSTPAAPAIKEGDPACK